MCNGLPREYIEGPPKAENPRGHKPQGFLASHLDVRRGKKEGGQNTEELGSRIGGLHLRLAAGLPL